MTKIILLDGLVFTKENDLGGHQPEPDDMSNAYDDRELRTFTRELTHGTCQRFGEIV